MCHKFNTFFNYQLFFCIFFIFLSTFFLADAQNAEIENKAVNISELNFKYQNNLIITYSSKKVLFDNYNFPKETTSGISKYDFSDYKQGVFKVKYAEYYKKDSFEFTSFLQINKSGMIYWFDKNNSFVLKKNTIAISLPLFKGKVWNTYLNDIKSTVTCISVDTVISTPIGNLQAFAIKSIINIKKKSTKSIDYNIAFTEFYNQKYGKIRMHLLEYGQSKDNNRIIKYKEEENTISGFLIPEKK
jgi:hypothetical protein